MKRGVGAGAIVMCVGALLAACSPQTPASPVSEAPPAGDAAEPDEEPSEEPYWPGTVLSPEELGMPAAMAFTLLEEAGGSDTRASGPGQPDLFVLWNLIRRDPHAADAFASMEAWGQSFHVQAMVILAHTPQDGVPAKVRELAGELPPAYPEAAAWTGEERPDRSDLSDLSPGGGFAVDALDAVASYDFTAGDEPLETKAMRVLLAERSADAAFRYLAGPERPARSRLVGLLGLSLVAPSAFASERTQVRDAPAPEPDADLPLSQAGEIALRVLTEATVFQFATVGEGGGTPSTVFALRVLVAESRAADAFRTLARGSEAVPKLYALTGLAATDPAAAREALADSSGDPDRVEIQSGCSISLTSFRRLARELVEGTLGRELAGR